MDRYIRVGGLTETSATDAGQWRSSLKVEEEDRTGATRLVSVCYRLWPCAVVHLLRLGANPIRQASFGGGVTPTLAALLGVADAVDIGRPRTKLLDAAHRCVKIWSLLGVQGERRMFPRNVTVGVAVFDLLQQAAARANETLVLVNLVRAEERMYPGLR